ncbi:1,4-alpha-glucan branching enzyme [Rubrobacter xylanophilus DSM 9941]|uniref:1,4-alpha-glucan branching enzyme GlgB n=1 Tax=Rubrobacter xylanophilus (strain DSM 9941 / JCM 11954 / NBRC 16129 / PRD-1) TaxID=266117 RepID=GLGB_RUBXD|nr:1,4-alpha-glucan branching protein GlgB [Rubrobacter xylanophilus]Q1AZ86.1 RecName: Full=1,4-alpha-glucan branching enzyme GlgB; AltName: Full=1,4-alpha-D-glucan:1,4-alpha-D-glucan 6-glucosyl-transferase; AltName: Full=Alpha-(1->4)-glucan branching enzyme; AltName: Full=Glycogen branching enzyme; Short=BE [Rubrobacter xylanophilus DSM 9941]ABG03292.1 1,4-alpha-glucan branching enzyme [Rubrobacter xylanophilus DSM 9941]
MRREEAIRAVVAGDHPDPFSFLGPHEEAGRRVVRTFLPGAARVRVLSAAGRPLGELERVHPEGFFSGPLSGNGRYRLRVLWEGGGEDELEDPYRFPPVLSDYDLYLFGEGNNHRIYRHLGAHPAEMDGVCGTAFAVWAPNARRVSVVGDFNLWDGRRHPMRNRNGVWEIFLPGVGPGALYKYEIKDAGGSLLPLKADPYGFFAEQYPGTASIVWDLSRHRWEDGEWMERRGSRNAPDAPMAIYEVHLGSWRRRPDGSHLTYRELAEELVPYVAGLGYTHVELLPPMEHPFGGSWGYQPVGLFAPTSRFGPPEDFKHLVDAFHRAGVGVIADWVPAHFPEDAHGLARFDGTHLYEHADPRKGRHPDWGTLIYNYGRNEVRNFLISNALFWLDEYHIDGLRVDAVASMLYLDYSRKEGEWVPNEHGGNENLEAIAFLRRMNEVVYGEAPGAFTVAEESTAWPMVSRPTYMGGLGFGYKWNMGWMHDTLQYMKEDPVHRRYHHDRITFGLLYAFNENFILPLSHDEVVHGKGSLLGRMPGDRWQRFANLRAYYGFMYGHPGKQLLFMGGEFAQEREWDSGSQLDWHLLEGGENRGVRDLVADLNALYRATPALHQVDFEPEGFEWVEGGDAEQSVVSFLRRARNPEDFVLVVSNFTPVVRHGYRVGVPASGPYAEVLNTDDPRYGGSGVANGELEAEEVPWHGRPFSLRLTLPPLATVFLRPRPV